VQINRLGGAAESFFRGSSCGVDDYDASEFSGTGLVVAQRCGSALELQVRGTGGDGEILTLSSVEAVAPAVVSAGREVFVAYVERGASSPTVAWFHYTEADEWLARASSRLPVDPDLELPLVSLDLASLDDGTVAIAWRGTLEADAFESFDASAGAFARVLACQDR